jgi:hypothetical protein
MSRGARGNVLVASLLVLVALAVGAASYARRRARHAAPAAASAVVAAGPASVDPTWCGKPLGSKAVGLLRDPSSCSKMSLTGTAPTCFFWADCGELHFEIDCAGAGPGQCRCDGAEGPAVPYSATFCTLDPAQPGAGLRAVLASAATACRWSPR